MIQAVLTTGPIIVAVVLIISVILIRVTPQGSYVGYFPGFISFGSGLILLLFATILDRIWIMGAGLGGWGIALLFAGAVSLMISAIVDSYRQSSNA